MKRGFGIGLLLLASALLLVTLGVTQTVPGQIGFLEFVEISILLLIQIAVLSLLFSDKKWEVSHFLVFLIAVLGVFYALRSFFWGVSNLGILAVIALNLLGFVLAIFGATTEPEPKVPRRQKRLDSYNKVPETIVYDVEEITKPKKTTKKRGRPKKASKKVSVKSANKEKTTKKKGSVKKASKKAVTKKKIFKKSDIKVLDEADNKQNIF